MPFEHLTEDLVHAIARRVIEHDPNQPTTWASIDGAVQHHLLIGTERFMRAAIPVLKAHGWTPPETEH